MPAKFGGLGIFIPMERCDIEYNNSLKITADMVETVYHQNLIYDPAINEKQKVIMNKLKMEKRTRIENLLNNIKSKIEDPIRLRSQEASLEKGASNWLTTLPIKEHGFYLEKRAFWDTLYLRYNIQHPNLPSKCACGKLFTIYHALSCPKGGFISIRHNEIRDFTASLLSHCHRDVHVEQTLTPLTGEKFPASTITTDDSRVDIAARGV